MALDAALLVESNLTEDSVRQSITDITKGVFQMMVMLDVEDKFPLTEPITSFHETVTSMVGLAGSHCGTVAVHCPKPLALKIASNMLGMDIEDINADVNDAMGEIANMIGGDIKNFLSPGGLDVDLSIPTVVYGDHYILQSFSAAKSLLVPFDCDGHQFILSFTIGKEG